MRMQSNFTGLQALEQSNKYLELLHASIEITREHVTRHAVWAAAYESSSDGVTCNSRGLRGPHETVQNLTNRFALAC